MISGFQANLKVDDGGTGAAPGGVSTAFSGLTTFDLAELTASGFNATEIDQTDEYEIDFPTGLIQRGPTSAMLKYTKANYQRLQAIMENGRGYTFVITTPDDLTNPGTPVKLTATIKGWISKIGKLVFEKGAPVLIPFEITFQEKGSAA